MDLILWRHAEAKETGGPIADTDRELTAQGLKQAQEVAEWPDQSGAIILVSHQPALGRLASLLLAGTEADWTIKKAGIWWFTNRVRHDETQTVLRAVHNP